MKELLNDTVIAGIDEAGLGPILGPLVVSAAAISIPSDKVGGDMWQFLSDSVSIGRRNLCGRLLICDSKKAYTPSLGTTHLKKTVLSCLKYLGRSAETTAELIDSLCPDGSDLLLTSPWYKNIGSQKINCNADEISISADVFARDLSKNAMNLTSLSSFCLDAGRYNELVDKVRNKSMVVFQIVCKLIDLIIKATPHKNFHFKIDRQGGRMRYGRHLMTMFGEMSLKVLQENDNASSYELSSQNKTVNLEFTVGADDIYLPTALASMASKYVREELMLSLNDYFIGLCDKLKPTAGYWTDGKRFLNDLKILAPHIRYNPAQLIRSR